MSSSHIYAICSSYFTHVTFHITQTLQTSKKNFFALLLKTCVCMSFHFSFDEDGGKRKYKTKLLLSLVV